jgi:hypothetical protein
VLLLLLGVVVVVVVVVSKYEIRCHRTVATRLGSVAGPVIQATGKSTFEDGLRSGGSGSDLT